MCRPSLEWPNSLRVPDECPYPTIFDLGLFSTDPEMKDHRSLSIKLPTQIISQKKVLHHTYVPEDILFVPLENYEEKFYNISNSELEETDILFTQQRLIYATRRGESESQIQRDVTISSLKLVPLYHILCYPDQHGSLGTMFRFAVPCQVDHNFDHLNFLHSLGYRSNKPIDDLNT